MTALTRHLAIAQALGPGAFPEAPARTRRVADAAGAVDGRFDALLRAAFGQDRDGTGHERAVRAAGEIRAAGALIVDGIVMPARWSRF